MTKRTQHIIDEISHLQLEEFEMILKEIHRRIDQQRRVESILDEYIGIGEGFWQTDAQEYVEELRREEEKSLPE
jgi:predicted translin family RNA/ssDNA-binding protein